MARIELESDHEVEIVVKNGQEADKVVSVDLMDLRLVVEQIERRHNLTVDNGRIIGTREFFVDLSRVLAADLGIEGLSTRQVHQLWVKLSDVTEALKKNTLLEQPSATPTDSTPSS